MVAITSSARTALILAAASLSVLSGTLVGTEVTAIGQSVSIAAAHRTWIMATYLTAMGLLLPCGGSLGDRFGRMAVLSTGVGVLGTASALCAFATDPVSFLLGRTLQGAAAAAVMPNASALIGALPRRRSMLPIYSSICTAGTALGPAIGGAVSTDNGWRWMFALIALLLLAVSIASAWAARREDADGRRAVAGPVRFADRRATALLTIYTAAIYGAFFDLLLSLPVRLTQAGYSPAEAGIAVLPTSLIVIFIGPLLADFSIYPRAVLSLAAASCLALIGAGTLAANGVSGPYPTAILVPLIVTGVAMALAAAPLTTAVLAAAGPNRSGLASGLNSAASRLGGAAAVTIHGDLAATFRPGAAAVDLNAVTSVGLLIIAAATSVLMVRDRTAPEPIRFQARRTYP